MISFKDYCYLNEESPWMDTESRSFLQLLNVFVKSITKDFFDVDKLKSVNYRKGLNYSSFENIKLEKKYLAPTPVSYNVIEAIAWIKQVLNDIEIAIDDWALDNTIYKGPDSDEEVKSAIDGLGTDEYHKYTDLNYYRPEDNESFRYINLRSDTIMNNQVSTIYHEAVHAMRGMFSLDKQEQGGYPSPVSKRYNKYEFEAEIGSYLLMLLRHGEIRAHFGPNLKKFRDYIIYYLLKMKAEGENFKKNLKGIEEEPIELHPNKISEYSDEREPEKYVYHNIRKLIKKMCYRSIRMVQMLLRNQPKDYNTNYSKYIDRAFDRIKGLDIIYDKSTKIGPVENLLP